MLWIERSLSLSFVREWLRNDDDDDETPFRYAHAEIRTEVVVICGPTRYQLYHRDAREWLRERERERERERDLHNRTWFIKWYLIIKKLPSDTGVDCQIADFNEQTKPRHATSSLSCTPLGVAQDNLFTFSGFNPRNLFLNPFGMASSVIVIHLTATVGHHPVMPDFVYISTVRDCSWLSQVVQDCPLSLADCLPG